MVNSGVGDFWFARLNVLMTSLSLPGEPADIRKGLRPKAEARPWGWAWGGWNARIYTQKKGCPLQFLFSLFELTKFRLFSEA